MDEARYGRLCLLTLIICPERLRGVIDNSHSPNLYNFETFLNSNIHDLFHLRFRSCCCRQGQNKYTPFTKPQWDSLFKRISQTNPHGQNSDCPCQYSAITGVTSDVLDVTLCCLFLSNLCSNILQTDVDIICKIRNFLIHTSTAWLDEATFNAHWNSVENALVSLSNTVSSSYTTDTRTAIQTLKNRIIYPAELENLKAIMMDNRDYDILKQVWFTYKMNTHKYFVNICIIYLFFELPIFA